MLVPRRLTRLIRAAVIVIALVVLVAPSSATAGRQWCRRDPIFDVAGTRVNVVVSVPFDRQREVNGPVKVVLTVPVGVAARVVFEDDGFNGWGERSVVVSSNRVKRGTGQIGIEVTASVPASTKDLPVLLTVTPGTGAPVTARGLANTPVITPATIKLG